VGQTGTVELALPPRLEQFVRQQVRDGRYADASEVVSDALRRLQQAEGPEAAPGLVREALTLATQAQRDVLALVQRADTETDVFHQVLGLTSRAVTTSLDIAGRIPVAREFEKVLRVSFEQVTRTAERGEQEAKQLRAGLESTARALGLLASVLERVNATTAVLGLGNGTARA
jgi:putative addiction module CopG family antidote